MHKQPPARRSPLKPHAATRVTPEQFLSVFPPATQALAQRLRRLIKQTLPHCLEAVYPGWRLLGYRIRGEGKSHYFAFLAPKQDHVVLGFEFGVFLSDPGGLLQGEGKQVRQLTIRSMADWRPRKFAAFIREAAALAAMPKAAMARKQFGKRS